jgi:hypothetical protein
MFTLRKSVYYLKEAGLFSFAPIARVKQQREKTARAASFGLVLA